MEHTKSTTTQDSQATKKATAPASKTVRFIVHRSEEVPFAYSAEVELPADAEAYCREFIRQMESTTRIAPEDVASNAQEGMRMHDKYGEKKLQGFMHATEALLIAENSTPPPTPPQGGGASADEQPTTTAVHIRQATEDGQVFRTVELPSDAEAYHRDLIATLESTDRSQDGDWIEALDAREAELLTRYTAAQMSDFAMATQVMVRAERTRPPKGGAALAVSESAPSYGTPSTPPRQVSPDMLRAFLADTDDLEDAIDEALGYLDRDDEDDDPDARMARELGEVEDCEESDYFERDLEDVIEDLLNGEGDDFIAMEDPAAYAAAAPALKHSGFKYHVEVTVWADADLRRFTWQLAGQDGAPTRFPFASAAEASKHARRTIKNASGVHEGRRTLHAHLLQELCERMNQPAAAQAVSEDGADYPAATPTPNVQDNSPRGSQAPKHAPELVTFFRKVLESGPIGILDQYAIEGDPESFRFSSVTERDRATGHIEYVFSPNEAESLQEEHDNLLGPHRAEDMIEAADAVNNRRTGSPDGDERNAPLIARVPFPAAPSAPPTAQQEIHPTTYPDHDDVTTVDVILYEEGRPRTVHVVKNVFGFFAQLRHFLAGTLDSYHPEEGVPTRFKEEHARLVALVGIDAMIDGAIAFEVWASRQELGKEKGTLASIHDNRPDDEDDPDAEPRRDADGNPVPDFEKDLADLQVISATLESRYFALGEDEDDAEENGLLEVAMKTLEQLRSRTKACAASAAMHRAGLGDIIGPDPDDDPEEPWRDLNGNAIPDYEEDRAAIEKAISALGTYIDELDEASSRSGRNAESKQAREDAESAHNALVGLRSRMDAYAESQENPAPSNAEHLLCRLTRALAAIGFGDPDATYDATDVLNIAEAHWQDMLLVTGIDQPAAETAAEVNAYARTEPFVGSHSSDSLDEARAIERADADGSILVNLRDSLAQLGFGTDEEVSGADLTDLLAEFWPSIDAAATAAKGGN